jgi:peptidyl-prolyl cis-trans isomerase B (cyclophilin B)
VGQRANGRRSTAGGLALAASAAALVIALGGCASASGTSGAGDNNGIGNATSSAPAPGGSAPQGSATTGSDAQGGITGSKKCTYAPTGGSVSLPPSTASPAGDYTATLRTSQGDIVIKLRNAQAPCTVNSFVHLAQANFWNGTQCHRISTDGGLYMLQCGDPTAKASEALSCDGSAGSGGPGYQFADENLAGATYPAGTVAMANAGPDTNGSQFFLVFQDTSLPPSYTPFGTITAGLDVLQKVAKSGTTCTFAGAGGGVPKDKVAITAVTITKS